MDNAGTPVRCGGCRCVLMNTEENGLLDAHSQPLHSASLSEDSCLSLQSRANLYLDDENLPEFVHNAVIEAGFTTGRLKCSKCGTRLGAFNFVNGNQCSCGSHTLPPVHFSFSKVDYLGYNKPSRPPVTAEGGPSSAEEDSVEPLLAPSSQEIPLAPLPAGPPSESPSEELPPVVVMTTDVGGERVVGPVNAPLLDSNLPSDADPQQQQLKNSPTLSPVHTTTDQIVADLTEYPDHLVCAICLELLFSPLAVKPCEHIFCEPCLRRLARPAPTNTSCPLCRETIGACQPAAEYSREVKQKFPKQLAERQKFEHNNCTQNLPLPWLQNYRFQLPSSGHRSHRYSRHGNWWRTALWIFWVDAVGFLLVITLNWILTQTMHKSEEQMPSFPHLPTSRKIPVLHSSNGGGDNGDLPYYLNKDPHRAWKYDGEEAYSGDLASTDFYKERQRYHPVTANPISLTTYSPGIHQSKVIKTEPYEDADFSLNYSDNEDGGPGSGSSADDGEDKSKNRLDRLTKHLFNSFDSFDDGGIGIDPTPHDDLSFDAKSNNKDENNDSVKRFRRKVHITEKVSSTDTSQRSKFYSKSGRALPTEGVRWWAD